MGKKTGGYIIVVLVTGYWFFMYDAVSVSWIFVLELIYPLFSILYLWLVSKKIQIQFVDVPAMGEKGKPIRLGVGIHNCSWIPDVRFRIRVIVKNGFSGKYFSQWLDGMTNGKKNTSVWYTYVPQDCGSMEISVESLQIYDFLGLFSWRHRVSRSGRVGIWPKYETVPLEISRGTREFQADSEEYSTEKSGDDSSEIFQIRPYQESDSIHNIHWKLSAREEELLVKESSFPLGCVVLLWFDFSEIGRNEKEFGQMLEAVGSLSMTLIEEKCIHMAAWFEQKNQRVVKWKVDGEEALYEMMQRLVLQEPCTDKARIEAYYEEAFRGARFGSTVRVMRWNKILVNGEQQEFLRL
ncbi:MAG: DUF58 domain-containing protein [Hespellia sp.]|nr:DUF58 domain-containing protein [Hespellia sp.]